MEILDLIAKISWDTNTKELQQVSEEMKKQDKLLDELRVKGGRLEKQIVSTNDPKKAAAYNRELQATKRAADQITEAQKKQVEVTKNIAKEQKNLQEQLRKTNDPNAVKGLLQNLHKVENQMTAVSGKAQTMGNKLGGLGMSIVGGLGVGFGVGAAVSFLSDSFNTAIAEYENAEKQARLLQGTLKSLGNEQYFDGLMLEATKLSETFKYLDNDDIISAQQQLLTYGKVTREEISSLLPIIINFSARTGQDIPAATSLIIGALEGQGKALKQYGISMKDAETFTERLALVQDVLGSKVEGAAEDFMNSSAGIKAAAEQQKADILESYGEAVSKIEMFFKTGIAGLYQFIKDMTTTNDELLKDELEKSKIETESWANDLSAKELEQQKKQNRLRELEVKESNKRILELQKAREDEGFFISRKLYNEYESRIQAEKGRIEENRQTIAAVNKSITTQESRLKKQEEERKRIEAERKIDEVAKEDDKEKKAIEDRKKASEKINQDYLSAQKTFEDEKEKSTLSAQEYELLKLNQHFDAIILAYEKAGKSIIEVEKLRYKLANDIRFKFEQDQINDLLKKQEEAKKVAKTLDPITGEFIPGMGGDISTLNPSSLSTTAFTDDEKEKQRLADLDKQRKKEATQVAKEQLYQETLNLASEAQRAIDIEKEKNDRLIALQEERVEATKGLSDKSLKIEEDRLQELLEKREKYERAQRLIDAAQIVANQALAVSNAIVAITKAARDGGPAAPFLIAANVIAIASGILAATSAVRSVDAGFKEGGYTGDGDPNDTSTNLGNRGYKYHKKEFVMDEDLTSKHRDLFEGLHKRDLVVKQLDDGKFYITKNGLDTDSVVSDHRSINQDSLNSAMLYEMQGIKELLKQRELNVQNNFDAQGFGQAVAGQMTRITLKNKMRTW
jgi:hypothetical protein